MTPTEAEMVQAKESSHYSDVVAYQQETKRACKGALDELAAQAQELGLGY